MMTPVKKSESDTPDATAAVGNGSPMSTPRWQSSVNVPHSSQMGPVMEPVRFDLSALLASLGTNPRFGRWLAVIVACLVTGAIAYSSFSNTDDVAPILTTSTTTTLPVPVYCEDEGRPGVIARQSGSGSDFSMSQVCQLIYPQDG